jgi:septum formation inhibitor MinC
MAETKKIKGNAEGEICHKGDLVVTGDVAAGAKLYIENGGLIVEGNVQDGAMIEQRNGADGSSYSVSVSSDNNINIPAP